MQLQLGIVVIYAITYTHFLSTIKIILVKFIKKNLLYYIKYKLNVL